MIFSEKKIIIPAEKTGIINVIKSIRSWLVENKVPPKEAMRACVRTEDILNGIIEKASPEAMVTIKVRKILGNVHIRLSCAGEAISESDIEQQLLGDMDSEEAIIIQNLYNSSRGDKIVTLNYQKGVNICQICVEKGHQSEIHNIILGVCLGMVVGLLLKYVASEAVIGMVKDYVISPFMTMFMNALQLMIGPLVFFSISASLADFSDLKTLRKWTTKLVGIFILSGIIAFIVGSVLAWSIPIGDSSLTAMVNSQNDLATTANQQDASILKLILGIIPDDLITPFMEGDTLQIIFIGVIAGIVGADLAESYKGFANFLSVGSVVVNKAMAIIMKFMPLMIFAAMTELFMTTDLLSFLKILSCWLQIIVGCLIVMAIYLIVIKLYLHVDINKMIAIILPVAMTGFSTASSSATMPTTLKATVEKLHIDSKLASLGISLGTTIHMDGGIMEVIVAVFFVANMYSVTITPDLLLVLALTIIPLNVGSPGIPNAGLVVIAIALMSIGIPGDAISIIMPIYALIDRTETIVNVTTDMLATAIVAKSDNLIGAEKI